MCVITDLVSRGYGKRCTNIDWRMFVDNWSSMRKLEDNLSVAWFLDVPFDFNSSSTHHLRPQYVFSIKMKSIL